MSSKYTMCTMCEEELVGFRLRAETRMFAKSSMSSSYTSCVPLYERREKPVNRQI